MLDHLVSLSIRYRIAVLVAASLLLIGGFAFVRRLPVDAVPDVTNVQVQVLTDAPGLSAEEVERMVTFPVEAALNGVPGLTEIRSKTRAGISAITVIFEEHMDVWFARQLVAERLRSVESDLPRNIPRPELAPVSTGLGEIYQFVLRSDRHTPMELRSMLDWEIIPRLRGVPGVIEVNAMGGARKQYEIVLDPSRMAAHGVSIGRVVEALERNNTSVGGGYIERDAEQYTIRGEGRLTGIEDIGSVVVHADSDGTPVLLRHLGTARIGASLPNGAVTRDGETEAVSGIVMMLIGQNSRVVVDAVKTRMAQIERDLPRGARIEVVYDRSKFISRTLSTVARNLAEGAGLVMLVIIVFLASVRGGALVTLGIPLAMTIAVAGMLLFHVPGNLMSLGAIDFGFLVDGPIVMLEAALARLALPRITRENYREEISEAIRRVTRPVVFSVLIVLLVYLPLLALEGVEGKMFRPMAATMALALFGSVVFALVIFPAAAVTFLKPPREPGHHGWTVKLEAPYRRVVAWVLRRRVVVMAIAGLVFVSTMPLAFRLGADFVPRIDEGDLVVGIRRSPSISLSEARRLDLAVERILRRYPEVVTTLGQNGRAEVAVDPIGVDESDILVNLRPPSEWRTAHDMDSLSEVFKNAIESEVPSTSVSISQPIEDRTNELISGSRADVAIQLYGDQLQTLSDVARRIGRIAREIPGAGDVRVERVLGLPMLQVRPDRGLLARYGIPSDDVLLAVEAARQGRTVGTVFENQRRHELRVLLPPAASDIDAFSRTPVGASAGRLVPLGAVAQVTEEDGAAVISREGMQRRVRVEINLRGRDLVSYVAEARARVEREVQLPAGFRLQWAGQFENFERAKGRLMLVVPLALGIIAAMLYAMFANVRLAAAVFSGVPFALVGGIVALAVRGLPFSIPAAVGFIALCGIAVLNGVVMASEVTHQRGLGEDLDRAIEDGATVVLRPLLLTATVAAFGFLPMALSTSAGSEVQRPLATVVIGGLASSTLLGMLVLPALLRLLAASDESTHRASESAASS